MAGHPAPIYASVTRHGLLLPFVGADLECDARANVDRLNKFARHAGNVKEQIGLPIIAREIYAS